jgi:drug/metabolite transporter (DMT)-like permease
MTEISAEAIGPGRRWLTGNTIGMGLMVLSTLAVAGMHGTIRLVPGDLHPFEKAFFRNFLGMLYFVPWLIRQRGTPLRTRHILPHVGRGLVNAGSMLCFFSGVSLVSLATVAAVGFSAPLFAIAFASLWLKEKVRMRRWIVLLCGFTGMLVLVRPDFGGIGHGQLLLLASALLWSVALLIIKNLAKTESSMTITVFMVLFMTPITGIAAAFVWQWPTWPQLAVLAIIAALGNVGQLTLTQSLKMADSSLVLPLDFLRLIWGSIFGWIAFNEWPDAWTWLGGAMIFASTTWLTLKERH